MKNKFFNINYPSYLTAQEAFEDYYLLINKLGIDTGETKCLYNVGFHIMNPSANLIDTRWRKWKQSYAEKEWIWYMSGNPSAKKIAESAKIWLECMDKNGYVNSNYGYQWQRGDQLDYVIKELNLNPKSRRAYITILDCKDRYNFERDTPCTLGIRFYIVDGNLNMSVFMRSNDLWYGFCNDQYCFSRLQSLVAMRLKIPIGTYFHFADDLHIYNKFLNKNK